MNPNKPTRTAQNVARYVAAGILFICFFYFILYVIGIVPHETKVTTYNEYTHHEDPEIYETTSYLIWQTFVGLNFISPAVTALATLGLVSFTYTLWRSTDKLWGEANAQAEHIKTSANAAKISAEAMIAVETPRVFLSSMMLLAPAPLGGADTREPISEPAPLWCRPTFSFTNFGRTYAEVIEIRWDMSVCLELPEGLPITFREQMQIGTVIEPNGRAFSHDSERSVSLVPEERDAILDGSARLWIFGRIRFRDFLGNTHGRRFCGAWWAPDPGMTSDLAAGFIEGGPDSYHVSN